MPALAPPPAVAAVAAAEAAATHCCRRCRQCHCHRNCRPCCPPPNPPTHPRTNPEHRQAPPCPATPQLPPPAACQQQFNFCAKLQQVSNFLGARKPDLHDIMARCTCWHANDHQASTKPMLLAPATTSLTAAARRKIECRTCHRRRYGQCRCNRQVPDFACRLPLTCRSTCAPTASFAAVYTGLIAAHPPWNTP